MSGLESGSNSNDVVLPQYHRVFAVESADHDGFELPDV
jgi:hypothetical protein